MRQLRTSRARSLATVLALACVCAPVNVSVAEDGSSIESSEKSAEQAVAPASAAPIGAGREEIVVTGRYESRSIDQSRFASGVLDVLNADDFALTGDSDVAGALSRVTGVTIVDDKFIYVRGLGERYSSTQFNKASLPSPDPARRIVPLDLFPSGVMKQLSIQKTYVPSLPGDFSGGAVELTTRDIPGERELKFDFSIEYNSETTFKKKRWHDGDGRDWTGFEGGFRDFPGGLSGVRDEDGFLPDSTELSDDQLRQVGIALDRSFGTDRLTLNPNIGADFSYGDSKELKSGSTLGWLIGAQYKNDWQYTDEERRTSKLRSVVENGEIRAITVQANDFVQEELENTIGYSTLATTEFAMSDSNLFKGTLFYTRLSDKRLIEDLGFLDENDRTVRDTSTEWEERQLWSLQLNGEHFFSDWAGLRIDWGTTFAQAFRDKPDTRFYQYEQTGTGEFIFADESGSNLRQWEDLQDDSLDFYVNGEIPVELTDEVLSTLKVGVKRFHKERESNLRKFRYLERFPGDEFDAVRRGDIGDVFGDDNIGREKWELDENTQFTDSYTAEETIEGVFFQTDTEIGPDWRLMAGARYEDSSQKTATRAVQGGTAVSANLEKSFILPALTLTWSFRSDMQLRAAYSQTINRPDIREISEASYLDPEDRDIFTGNPALTIAEIKNYDLRWEWYYGGLDNLQLALFYKEFSDPIEETLLLAGGQVRRTYENAEGAELYGAEFAIRQGLEFLGDWSRDFYVKFNGALMDSEVTASREAINQTNPKRKLQGQSDWVMNLQLTYDNQPADFQATLAFNAFGERISDVGVNGLDDAYEQTLPLLDLNLRYGFTWNEIPMRLKLKLKNLLDPDHEVNRGGVIERRSNEGRSLSIGLEMAF